MKTITEIRNDYTDDQNYTHIDIWEDDEEECKTVAIVCQDTKKVYFIDNGYRSIPEIKIAINEVIWLPNSKLVHTASDPMVIKK